MGKGILVGAAIAAFAAVVLSLMFAQPAKAQHDNLRNEAMLAYATCPTLEGALAIIEAPVPVSVLLWGVHECVMANDGVWVVAHKIAAERVWVGDGLGDLMLVMEVYDITGLQAWAWAVKEQFASQFPDQLRLLQPTLI